MHIVAAALEEGMRLDVDLDQRVAGRTAAHARHALALEAQRLAVLGARRDAHVPRLAVGQLDAFFGALGRSDERLVGQECVRPCTARWSTVHYKKNRT